MTAIATWTAIDAVIKRRMPAEMEPLALLNETERDQIIADIETAMDAIEYEVTAKFPDLEDEEQRAARLFEYKKEYLKRVAPIDREAHGSYFDNLMGIYIRNGREVSLTVVDGEVCAAA